MAKSNTHRKISWIVLHCTATSQTTKVASIVKFWKEVNGWAAPGYHFIIKPDGTYENLQPIEKPSNGVAGHNANSIHISYIGGIDKNRRPVDNRTGAQKQTQIELIKNNHITNYGFCKDDGGGIYNYGSTGQTLKDTGSIIRGNIIINGTGAATSSSDAGRYAHGIYLDG